MSLPVFYHVLSREGYDVISFLVPCSFWGYDVNPCSYPMFLPGDLVLGGMTPLPLWSHVPSGESGPWGGGSLHFDRIILLATQPSARSKKVLEKRKNARTPRVILRYWILNFVV